MLKNCICLCVSVSILAACAVNDPYSLATYQPKIDTPIWQERKYERDIKSCRQFSENVVNAYKLQEGVVLGGMLGILLALAIIADIDPNPSTSGILFAIAVTLSLVESDYSNAKDATVKIDPYGEFAGLDPKRAVDECMRQRGWAVTN